MPHNQHRRWRITKAKKLTRGIEKRLVGGLAEKLTTLTADLKSALPSGRRDRDHQDGHGRHHGCTDWSPTIGFVSVNNRSKATRGTRSIRPKRSTGSSPRRAAA
jgi:hypothetical protein